MKRFILTTVSVIALGLGGFGVSYAANTNPGSTAGTTAPAAGGTTAGGNTANPGTMSLPSGTGTSQSGYNAAESQTGHWGMGQHMNRRDEVSEVQQKLQQQGIYHGNVDGILGQETRQALRQYQQQNGLRATASLDQQTLEHLLGNSPVG